jgi:hypothetical protein
MLKVFAMFVMTICTTMKAVILALMGISEMKMVFVNLVSLDAGAIILKIVASV